MHLLHRAPPHTSAAREIPALRGAAQLVRPPNRARGIWYPERATLPPSMAFPTEEIPLLCLVGAGAASFWRGAWYTMDATLFPDSVPRSCAASLTLGFGGFAALHVGLQRLPHSMNTPMMRGIGLYSAALMNVAAWRGVWMGWDLATSTGTAVPVPVPLQSDIDASAKKARLRSTPTGAPVPIEADDDAVRRRQLYSGVLSHICAAVLLFRLGYVTSAMAPPARIGVLSDRMSWAEGRKSKYLEDIGMFLNNKPRC